MSRGFTLIEMVIVMAIILLMAGMSAATSLTFLRRERLDVAAETTIAEISQAQSDAYTLRNDHAYGIKVFETEVVRFEGTSYAARQAASDVVTAFPGDVTVSGLAELQFAPGSLRPTTAGTLTLQDGSQSFLITISSYGIIERTAGTN